MRGIFEIHITVANIDPDTEPLFLQACERMKLKAVLIELPYGATQEQLMTSSWTSGKKKEAIEEAKRLATLLKDEGFKITRVKVEAGASNKGVPLEEPPQDPTLYFEFHVKLRVDDEEALKKKVAPHQGHLSRNSLKGSPDIKFVTLRVYHKGKKEAFKDLAALLEALEDETVLAVHREFAVYDSNVHLDKGWIDVSPPSP
eukprot:CAMPEP_0174264606 /NCGR_PEP_ID=MMETSP0439-20130205/23101_1 /TAXON_ID=0 /ORGANISM="Stereomyxa ramosa, Strain Chinc5" /LENGTH=200 /DNA_ID=CAMNT_0015350565 /DNA_START=86 /DNA_END=688 /DNA_ORIENTATION=-